MKYDLDRKKWDISNCKCLMVAKSTILDAIRGSIPDCDTALKMSNTASKLKPIDLGLKDEFLIHLVFASLPKEYETFVVNYNLQPDKWDIEKLIAMCVQEEERLKSSHGDSVNHVKENKKKNFNNKNAKTIRETLVEQ